MKAVSKAQDAPDKNTSMGAVAADKNTSMGVRLASAAVKPVSLSAPKGVIDPSATDAGNMQQA